MASDPKDHYPLRPSDAASAAGHTSTFAAANRKVKFLCSYGGKILPRASDGALRYAGGETRIITVRRDSPLPEVLRKMAEAYGGPMVLRYQLPDEDLDALISVSTAEDLENMLEEYDKLAADNPNAKLRVFLFSPSEVAGAGADPLVPYHDVQATGTRYLEAVNGLDSSIRRKDSATSFSSTQNSDGMTEALVNEDMGREAVTNGGVLPPHVLPTSSSVQDALTLAFSGQDDLTLLPATSSSDQTELLSTTQSEWPPFVPNQNTILNSIQYELPPMVPYVQQTYLDPQHAQMMNPQYLLVMGLPPPINIAAVPSHAYVPPAHIGASTFQVSNGMLVQTRVNPHLENLNVDKIANLPGDVKLQPLPQLPPLPSPHLLAPNAERNGLRQVPSSSHGLTMRTEHCSLCQSPLPHAHSDTLINEQGNGLRNVIPDANIVHSEDLIKMRAPQIVAAGMPLDTVLETQPENLVAAAPSKTYEFAETITEMPQDSGRPVVTNASNPYHAKVLVPPVSVGLPGISQTSYGTVTNPQKTRQEDSVKKKQEVPLTLGPNTENLEHPDILVAPSSLALPCNPYGKFIIPPQSHGEDSLQQQTQLPQHIGFPKYPINQDFISKPLVIDTSLVGNSDYQQDGQSVHGTVPTYLCGCVRPIDGMMGSLCTMPRPVVMPDIGTSKDLKPEKLPLVIVNTHNVGPQDMGNELPLSNPLINSIVVPEGNAELPLSNPLIDSVFVPEGNAGVLIDQKLPMVGDVAYVQSVQPANTNHIPNMTGNHGPLSNHLEAGAGPRGMLKYVDPVYNNNVINKNPIGEWKDEATNLHPVEVVGSITIPQSDNPQFCTIRHTSNMDQLQQAVSLDSLVTNKDPQKIRGSILVLPPRPSNVSVTESIAMKNHPVSSMGFEISVPAQGVSCNLPDSLNMDSPTELACPLKEGIHIKQDIQTFEGRASASELQSSEVPVPVLICHETKEISPSSGKECDTIENNIETDDEQTETIKTKQSEKVKNGFPITDDIGHLQVIKNSDLEQLQELGSGTFGTVYHGKWRGSDVAIKRINDRIFAGKPSEQERARADFWNEACKLASLHHPNVVAFYGIVLDGPGGSIATATEFMANGSLRHALQKNEKILDRRRCLLIAMDVAFGMEYLHNKNIIHFDLKSDNLLVNLRDPQRPICKVGDLGLSKVKYETLMSGGMQGTLPWMAPELLGGKDNKYTEKVDVFSFGIVMWELITGEEPYKDMHYGAIIGGILNDTLRPRVHESCDAEWRSLMEHCWATEPSQRPSFTEIASRLRAMAASLPQKG